MNVELLPSSDVFHLFLAYFSLVAPVNSISDFTTITSTGLCIVCTHVGIDYCHPSYLKLKSLSYRFQSSASFIGVDYNDLGLRNLCAKTGSANLPSFVMFLNGVRVSASSVTIDHLELHLEDFERHGSFNNWIGRKLKPRSMPTKFNVRFYGSQLLTPVPSLSSANQ